MDFHTRSDRKTGYLGFRVLRQSYVNSSLSKTAYYVRGAGGSLGFPRQSRQ